MKTIAIPAVALLSSMVVAIVMSATAFAAEPERKQVSAPQPQVPIVLSANQLDKVTGGTLFTQTTVKTYLCPSSPRLD